MSEALSFQKQIAELKQNLEELARENVEARLSLSELSLKTEELKICNAELAKVSDARKRCQKWADDLDTEKSDQAAELNEASAKLAEELPGAPRTPLLPVVTQAGKKVKARLCGTANSITSSPTEAWPRSMGRVLCSACSISSAWA